MENDMVRCAKWQECNEQCDHKKPHHAIGSCNRTWRMCCPPCTVPANFAKEYTERKEAEERARKRQKKVKRKRRNLTKKPNALSSHIAKADK